jgi:FMN phosphatase YigB (HAD superfamily)
VPSGVGMGFLIMLAIERYLLETQEIHGGHFHIHGKPLDPTHGLMGVSALTFHGFMDGFVISGDVGARKPDTAIFGHLLAQTGAEAEDIILVDDRPRNLDAAAALGLQTILFGRALRGQPTQHRAATDFNQLFEHVCETNGA